MFPARLFPLLAGLGLVSLTAFAEPLPGTAPLAWEGDPAARVVDSIDRYLDARMSTVVADRAGLWLDDHRDAMRARLGEILGVVDPRDPVAMRFTTAVPGNGGSSAALLARGSNFRVFAVAWNVFRGVEGEGLLLVPDGNSVADVVLVPDCDSSPEALAGIAKDAASGKAFGVRLAEAGCRVVIPVLLDRSTTNGGNPGYRHMEMSQRETWWRAAYEVGRTPTGYEIQKALAAADWLVASRPAADRDTALAIAGHGEGGRVALHAAALDPRFTSALVSGYFQPREQNWREPIDRNAFSYIRDFGDAEIATLVRGRLAIEDGAHPAGNWTDAHGAAPGSLARPEPAAVAAEIERARALMPADRKASLVSVNAATNAALGEGAWKTLAAWLGLRADRGVGSVPAMSGALPDPVARQARQYRQVLDDTQALVRSSPEKRKAFWKEKGAKTENLAAFTNSTGPLRDYFRTETVGIIPAASVPPVPQSRLLYETNGIRGYEVVLQVHDGLPAYGILVLPAGMKDGERRPVVVCQHGLEGRPTDVADPRVENSAYHRYAYRLAEQGYITFAPQNAYIGNTRFRQVLRKAQPMGLTLWSFVVRQHEVITDWLASRGDVDPRRIAFYGLSYGGKSAMRIPVWVDRYCLSICSADYNEWIWKCTSTTSPYSYLFNNEYDMPEWNLANTYNYAELSWLVCPRPFMVERGHDDGVAPDEWVAYEYARTRRQYVKLGIGDRTEIEFFDGPHTIHGVGTFAFLKRWLGTP